MKNCHWSIFQHMLQSPSPYIYGCQYINKLLKLEIAHLAPNVLSEEVASVIENTDMNVLIYTMNFLFDSLKQENPKQQILKQVAKAVITKFQENLQFKNMIVQFFDGFSSYPINCISQLLDETIMTLAVYGCFQNMKQKQKNFWKILFYQNT